MSLFGSPFQQIVTTAVDLTVTVGTDAVVVTAAKNITLPRAYLCTLEQGNNVIRVAAAGAAATILPTSPDTLATADSSTVIGDGNVAYCESDGLGTWWVIGSSI